MFDKQHPFVQSPMDIIGLQPGDPGAGANASFIVPVNCRIMPVTIEFDALTDATATNRVGRISINDGAISYPIGCHSTLHGAGAQRHYVWIMGLGNNFEILAGVGFNIEAAHLSTNQWARFGDTILCGLWNIQAGDQISNFRIRYYQEIFPREA